MATSFDAGASVAPTPGPLHGWGRRADVSDPPIKPFFRVQTALASLPPGLMVTGCGCTDCCGPG